MRGTTFVLAIALVACAKSKKAEPPEEPSKHAQADAGSGGRGDRDAAAASGSGGHASHPGPDAGHAPDAAGSGGTSSIPDPSACSTNALTASPVVPTVMLVIDGSSSMMSGYGNNPDGGVAATADAGTGTTRWQALRHALVDPAEGVVPALQGRVKFGLAVFGTMPTCPLPLGVIDAALNNAVSIESGLPMDPPGLTTPTGSALDQIVDMLPDPTAAAGANAGPQVVVLATDGDPNQCIDASDPNMLLNNLPVTDYAPSIAAATKLQQKHLRMYVVGVGDEAAKMHLQQMANLGAGLAQDASPGAAVYYPADPSALTDTLRTLIGDQVSCDVALSGEGVRAGEECKGLVTLDGTPLACNDADGWVLKDATHITLQGAACETFRSSADVAVRAQFPCHLVPKN